MCVQFCYVALFIALTFTDKRAAVLQYCIAFYHAAIQYIVIYKCIHYGWGRAQYFSGTAATY